ncbi:MAG: M28 family metallopeptidase [Planctomycetota bacterium]|jgi:hypothetical protein
MRSFKTVASGLVISVLLGGFVARGVNSGTGSAYQGNPAPIGVENGGEVWVHTGSTSGDLHIDGFVENWSGATLGVETWNPVTLTMANAFTNGEDIELIRGDATSTRGGPIDISGEVAGLVDEFTYRHYLDDLLYTHDGDHRYFWPKHDLARDNIVATFESFGLSVELHPFTAYGMEYYNVVATQLGEFYPEEYFVASAHYDTGHGPGADDNGSGVAGILEIARVLAQYQTEYTIKYIAFDKEEQGAPGSRSYVQDHLEDTIVTVVNMDMIAYDNGDYTALVRAWGPYMVCEDPWGPLLVDAVEEYGGALSAVCETGPSGDQKSFTDAGFSACGIREGSWDNPHYHSPTDSVDTPDYISYDYAADITRSVAAFLAKYAGAHHAGDCNDDGVPDADQILADPSLDCTGNGILDVCERDCNENGLADTCDLTDGTSTDCSGNGIPDECEPDCNDNGTADSCDIAYESSEDCDGDGVPDECQDYIDCNANDEPDFCDIASGTSADCNDNDIPDDCEPDCNGNGVADDCDIAQGDSGDCSLVSHDCCVARSHEAGGGCSDPALEMGICLFKPECCEVEWHLGCVSRYCYGACEGAEGNGIPDECEPDCNNNGVADSCDIATGTSQDCSLVGHDCCVPGLGPGCSDPERAACVCGLGPSPPYPPWLEGCCDTLWHCGCVSYAANPACGGSCEGNRGNGVPDECEPDCNNNGVGDSCDIAGGTSDDCGGDGNGIPDDCEPDCNTNGAADSCDILDLTSGDCNSNWVPDECEPDDDCNENGVQDICDIAAGTSGDCNLNSIPDSCDIAEGTSSDNNGDGTPDECLLQLSLPGPPHDSAKHRYLSIDPSANSGRDTAIKVEVAEMRRCVVDPRRACLADEDCDPVCANDLDKYCTSSEQCGGADCIETGPCWDMAPDYDPPLSWIVQQPVQEPEGSGCKRPGCPPYDPGEDNCCTDEDWVARLSDTVYSENWSAQPLLHIGDCGVVPCTTYKVYACDPLNLDECGEPLVIATQRFPALFPFKLYGDVTGGTVLPGPEVLPPDGYVNVADLQVTLLTILNYGTVNKPQAQPTWVDLHGLGAGIPPNYILNVSDLQAVYVYSLTNGLPWVNTQGGLRNRLTGASCEHNRMSLGRFAL